MKCTNCGSVNLIETNLPMTSYGDGGAYLSYDTDVYLCLDCGHYEIFSTKRVNRYYEVAAWINKTEAEIAELNSELSKLQNPTLTQKIHEKIKSVEKQLESVDITIRQQQKLKTKLSELKREVSSIPGKISCIKSEIRRLESELHTKKNNFENGHF